MRTFYLIIIFLFTTIFMQFSLSAAPGICTLGKVVYTSTDNPKKIFIYDIKTKDTTSINTNSEIISYPTWSNRGGNIAYVEYKNEKKSSIKSISINGETKREITNSIGINLTPSWAIDDLKIIFSSNKNGKFAIYSIDLETEQEIQITHEDFNSTFPSISPNKTELTFTGEYNNKPNIFLKNIGQNESSKKIENAIGFNSKWSPDGEKILFISIEGNETVKSKIVIFDINKDTFFQPIQEKKSSTLIKHIAYSNAIWSIDENCIMYRKDIDGENNIMSYDLITNEEFRIIEANSISWFDWYSK